MIWTNRKWGGQLFGELCKRNHLWSTINQPHMTYGPVLLDWTKFVNEVGLQESRITLFKESLIFLEGVQFSNAEILKFQKVRKPGPVSSIPLSEHRIPCINFEIFRRLEFLSGIWAKEQAHTTSDTKFTWSSGLPFITDQR